MGKTEKFKNRRKTRKNSTFFFNWSKNTEQLHSTFNRVGPTKVQTTDHGREEGGGVSGKMEASWSRDNFLPVPTKDLKAFQCAEAVVLSQVLEGS